MISQTATMKINLITSVLYVKVETLKKKSVLDLSTAKDSGRLIRVAAMHVLLALKLLVTRSYRLERGDY